MSHTQYAPARQRLQRSELAVPGSNPAMFEKAANSAADYVFLDLEESTASIRTTCIAMWSTWWSRPVIDSTRF
jgi:hypothetical protein